jgi:ABC-type Mn2+/Zn2+ transport system permease subunit
MTDILHLITQPMAYPFMLRGLLASLLVGTLCATIGSFVVLRGMAFFGDALAHAILPGIAVAYLLAINIFWGALVMGLFTAIGIGYLSQRSQIKEDTAIGVIFAASFALGVALLSTVETYSVDLTHILFGDVLSVSTTDLWLIAGLGLVVFLVIFFLYKELMVVSFDPVLAATLHLPLNALNYLLLLLIAMTIVVSLQTVGVALLVAMLVTPAATAYLLTQRLWKMMLLGALFGAFSSITGLYFSFYVNVPSGAAVVLVCTFLFVLAFLFSPRKGLITTYLRSKRAARKESQDRTRPYAA